MSSASETLDRAALHLLKKLGEEADTEGAAAVDTLAVVLASAVGLLLLLLRDSPAAFPPLGALQKMVAAAAAGASETKAAE
jgi:hypothetical protein